MRNAPKYPMKAVGCLGRCRTPQSVLVETASHTLICGLSEHGIYLEEEVVYADVGGRAWAFGS